MGGWLGVEGRERETHKSYNQPGLCLDVSPMMVSALLLSRDRSLSWRLCNLRSSDSTTGRVVAVDRELANVTLLCSPGSAFSSKCFCSLSRRFWMRSSRAGSTGVGVWRRGGGSAAGLDAPDDGRDGLVAEILWRSDFLPRLPLVFGVYFRVVVRRVEAIWARGQQSSACGGSGPNSKGSFRYAVSEKQGRVNNVS